MKIKKIVILFSVILFLFALIQSVSAVELLPESCTSPNGCSLCDFVIMFINASNILVGLSGTFAILMFVYGGLVMITAYGNDARIKWGKDILVATVTGIFIVMLAWTLINLIIGALLGNPDSDWANINKEGVCSAQTK